MSTVSCTMELTRENVHGQIRRTEDRGGMFLTFSRVIRISCEILSPQLPADPAPHPADRVSDLAPVGKMCDRENQRLPRRGPGRRRICHQLRQQRLPRASDKDRLARHPVFANLATVNYILAGVQRVVHGDDNKNYWKTLRSDLGMRRRTDRDRHVAGADWCQFRDNNDGGRTEH